MSHGQQVGRELDAPHRAVDGAGQRLGELGLADPGHVLDEQVAFGEQDGEPEADGVVLALDNVLDVRGDASARGTDRFGC